MGYLITTMLFVAALFAWPQGWPFWPIWICVVSFYTVWGAFVGSWKAPALVLCGYLGMRGVIWGLDPIAHEVAGFLVWAVVAALLYRVKAYIPGLIYLISGAVYPLMVLFGFQIEYLGLAPIIADVIALFALIAMGGGLYERSLNTSRRSDGRLIRRLGTFFSDASLGMAPSQRRS